MPAYVYAVIVAGWLIWMTPFFLIKRGVKTPQKVDTRARWGIVLEAIAYSAIWQTHFWIREPAYWRVVLGVICLTLAGVLSWTSARTLGRQWRVDAGLNADHQLVQSGAYRVVRHPIYTSMLCMLLGTGFLITPLLLLVMAVVIFVVGTEIRVRIEDRLLASRFGAEFENYRRRVPAYLPLGRKTAT
ncbi:MAG: isoprenylcysteine carboxylmethyltransferase family protein [Acidobacteriota bacterium]